ncbi:MAG: IS200/IS605 family transposase [Prevotella sp.]|nr:IS200/IS605 family transposase [Prevotella sp.]
MNTRWKTNAGSIYNLSYHLIWCPKYRRKVLISPIDERLRELITEKCAEQEWDLKAIEVLPDHVHLFISATPSDSVAYIISQLKGYTAYKLRKEFPSLKHRLPSLWTRSYYVESVGHISEATVKKYIADQKNK